MSAFGEEWRGFHSLAVNAAFLVTAGLVAGRYERALSWLSRDRAPAAQDEPELHLQLSSGRSRG